MSELYRLVYTSRNLLEGGEAEQKAAVAGLLAVSKRNNARVGVTGALLFNGGSFAQVLEGSRAAVESTFERIQRDPRHSDVSVLQCEPVAARGFPNWSMGFVGNSPRGRALWTDVARLTNFDVSRLEGHVLFNTLLSIVKEEEGEAAPAGLDTALLRSELSAHRPAERAMAAPAPIRSGVPGPTRVEVPAPAVQEAEAGVLRTALDAERARTTALRGELDDARTAVATLQAQLAALGKEAEVLRRNGAVWAERAKAMAAVMMREPGLGEDDARDVA